MIWIILVGCLFAIIVLVSYSYFKNPKKDEEKKEEKDIIIGEKTNIKRDMYISFLLDKPENINKKITMFYRDIDKLIPVGIYLEKGIFWCEGSLSVPISDFTGFKFSKSETDNQNQIMLADSLALQNNAILLHDYYDTTNRFMFSCVQNNITSNRRPIIVKNNINDVETISLFGSRSQYKRNMKIKNFLFDENKGKEIVIYYNNNNKEKIMGIELDNTIKLWNNFNVPIKLFVDFYSDSQVGSQENKHVIKLCDVTCDIGYENSFIIYDYKDTDNVISVKYKINGVDNASEDLIVEQDYSLFSLKRMMTIKNFVTEENDNKIIELFVNNNDVPIGIKFDKSIILPLNFETIDKLGNFTITESLNGSYTITYKNNKSSMVIEYYKNSFNFRVFFYKNNLEFANTNLIIFDDDYYNIGNKRIHIIYSDNYSISDNSIVKEYISCNIPNDLTEEEKTQAQNICESNRTKTIILLNTDTPVFTQIDDEKEIIKIPYTILNAYDKDKIVEITSLIKNIIAIKFNYTLDEVNNIIISENDISAVVPIINKSPVAYTKTRLIKNFNNDSNNINKKLAIDYSDDNIPIRFYFVDDIVWNENIGNLKNFYISRIYKLQNSSDYFVRLFKLSSTDFIDFYFKEDLFTLNINYKNILETALELYDTIEKNNTFVIFGNDYKILNNNIVRYQTSCIPSSSTICNQHNYKNIITLSPESLDFGQQIGNTPNVLISFQLNNIFDRRFRNNIISLLREIVAKFTLNLLSDVTNVTINYSTNKITANAPFKYLNQPVISTRNMIIKNFGFSGNQNKLIKVYNTTNPENPNLSPVPFKMEFDETIILPSFVSSERQINPRDLIIFNRYNNNILITNIFGEGIIINNYGNDKYTFDVISSNNQLEGTTELSVYKSETLESGQVIIYQDNYELLNNNIILRASNCFGENCSTIDLNQYNKLIITFNPKSNIFGGNLSRKNVIQDPLRDTAIINMNYTQHSSYDQNMLNQIYQLIREYFANLFQLNPNYITNITIDSDNIIRANSQYYCHYLRTENQCLGGQLWSVDVFNDPRTCVQGRYIGSC